MKILRGLQGPTAIASAALLSATVVVTVMKENNWRHASWWGPGSAGQLVFILVSIATAAASLYVTIALWRALRRRDMTVEFAKAGHGIARLVETSTSLVDGQFGVNIWKVQGPRGFRRLVRVPKAMVAPRHHETPVRWTKQKGVIGEAWDRGHPRFADLDRVRAAIPSERVFCQMPPEDRFRLSWREFSETSRYHAVLAVPLHRLRDARYEVAAVIAIDSLVGGKADEIKGIEQLPEFESIRATCEAALSGEH